MKTKFPKFIDEIGNIRKEALIFSLCTLIAGTVIVKGTDLGDNYIDLNGSHGVYTDASFFGYGKEIHPYKIIKVKAGIKEEGKYLSNNEGVDAFLIRLNNGKKIGSIDVNVFLELNNMTKQELIAGKEYLVPFFYDSPYMPK